MGTADETLKVRRPETSIDPSNESMPDRWMAIREIWLKIRTSQLVHMS